MPQNPLPFFTTLILMRFSVTLALPLLPFEQKFKQVERNSGGNSFRLNKQIISRKIFAKELILDIHRSRAAGFGVVMSRNN